MLIEMKAKTITVKASLSNEKLDKSVIVPMRNKRINKISDRIIKRR